MAAKKPIDRQYLLDSLKKFDQEILSKKYSNNSPEEKITKEMVESLLLSEAALSETFAEGDTVPIVTTDESGHRSVTKLTTVDSLATEVAGKIDIPGIDVDIASGILLYGSVVDPIQKNHSTTVTENFFIGPLPKVNDAGYGLLEQGKKLYRVMYHISSISSSNIFTIVYDSEPELVGGGSVNFADVPIATELATDDYAVVGTEVEMQKIKMNAFIEFLKSQDLIDLDGKGRPLLPGYGIVTKEVDVNFGNSSYVDFGIGLEDFGLEKDDVVQLFFFLKEDNYVIIPYINFNHHLAVSEFKSSNITLSSKGVLGVLYKQKVPYEPGLKTVSLTKTITSNQNFGYFGNIKDDFGISNLSTIVSVNIKSDNIIIIPYYVNYDLRFYYPTTSTSTKEVTVTLLVKDYSSIGPAIVTDGIRMITKELKNVVFNSNGQKDNAILITDLGISKNDIVGITSIILNQRHLVLPYVTNDYISLSSVNSTPGTYDVMLNVFVKVPVVEPQKPFVKDVEGTFSNAAWTTLLTLDGSDEVGGFTKDTVGSISVMMIPVNGLNLAVSQPIVQDDGRVQVLLYGSGHYPGKVRVKIYPI